MNRGTAVFFIVLSISYGGICKNIDKGSKSLKQEKWKTFKSDLGYEIQYPPCMAAGPSNHYDFEKKVETLKEVILTLRENECQPLPNYGGVSISVYLENENATPIAKRIKSMYDYRMRGSSSRIYQKMNTEYLLTNIMTSSSNGIIWEIFRPCGKDIFQFRLATKGNESADPNLINAIKKGDASIPEVERKIIDSFKCLRSE